ncbi:MAG: tryptophan synthase subunit alpha [Gemmatimonadetes bacterium]|nr:tryptophan synthase subunit alpha [Gemmatimonadota bacterium]
MRIAAAFAERRAKGEAALIPYSCAGFPSRQESLELLHAAAGAGADLIELGIPFSDPLADGPTIQKATFEALRKGMTVRGVLDVLREFRRSADTPVVLMTYLNPIYHFGLEAFVSAAREAGADGLLITDLPANADPELEETVQGSGLDLIRLLAPTTSTDRIPVVASGASGYLYYLSRTGVTGARTELRVELAREIEAIRAAVDLPVAVGFGVSTPEHAALLAEVADGVIVGSALLDAVGAGGVSKGAAFLSSLRAAMDGVVRQRS